MRKIIDCFLIKKKSITPLHQSLIGPAQTHYHQLRLHHLSPLSPVTCLIPTQHLWWRWTHLTLIQDLLKSKRLGAVLLLSEHQCSELKR